MPRHGKSTAQAFAYPRLVCQASSISQPLSRLDMKPSARTKNIENLNRESLPLPAFIGIIRNFTLKDNNAHRAAVAEQYRISESTDSLQSCRLSRRRYGIPLPYRQSGRKDEVSIAVLLSLFPIQ